MAKKKPLVLGSTGIEQLQTGDYLGEVDLISLTNGEAGAVVIGAPVYISAASTYKKAKGDAAGTTPVFGLQVDVSVAAAGTGSIQTEGILAATTVQWDAITGQSGGLTPNAYYYLSNATAGLLTLTQPSTGYWQVVGIAVSTTEMKIMPGPVIKL